MHKVQRVNISYECADRKGNIRNKIFSTLGQPNALQSYSFSSVDIYRISFYTRLIKSVTVGSVRAVLHLVKNDLAANIS